MQARNPFMSVVPRPYSRPSRRVSWKDVGVAVEHHAAVDLGPDPGVQVGAGARIVEAQIGLDVRRGQVVADIGDEIEVGLSRQAYERDEPVENLHRRVDSVFHVDEHSLAGACPVKPCRRNQQGPVRRP
jgi:hypothetical protein